MTADREAGPRVVLGPCPGCDAWQLDFVDTTPVAEVNAVVRAHAEAECPALMAIAIRVVFDRINLWTGFRSEFVP